MRREINESPALARKSFFAALPGGTEQKRRLLRHKVSSASFVGEKLWHFFRFILLLSISFVIIFPILVKLSSAFMSYDDLMDKTVRSVPKNPTLENITSVIEMTGFWTAAKNTLLISAVCAIAQMAVAATVGYSLAKFKYRGRTLLFLIVILLMIIPPQTILISLYMKFMHFDIFGLFKLIFGAPLNLIDTPLPWSTFIMAFTGLGLKNGLYIFLMRQFYLGVPDELIEAAYIDGSGVYRTFFRIILPMSRATMISILLLSFAWQWTDSFFSTIFYTRIDVLANKIPIVYNTVLTYTRLHEVASVQMNTALLLLIAPLLILYIFCQRYFIQGLERSGITG